MALYPDLAACGVNYIQFAFHVAGGQAAVDAFWEARHVDSSAKRLLFSSYSRQGVAHTVWLQWARSHEDCCDVLIGLERCHPSELWPKLKASKHRLREKDLRDFFEAVAKLDGLGRVQARYAFPWNKNIDQLLPLPSQVRPISLTLEILEEAETKRPAMRVTYERLDDESWQALVAPVGRFEIKDEPVKNTFFKAPYDIACSLAKYFHTTAEQS